MGGVQYWSEDTLDLGFAGRVVPDVARLHACIQCGSCTASCPTSGRMAVSPQRLIRLLRLGLKAAVFESGACWLCTSCNACTMHCPRGVPVLDTMIGLKTFSIGEALHVPEDVGLLRDTLKTTRNVSGDPNQERMAWSSNLPQPLGSIEMTPGADVLYFVGCVSAFYPRAFSIPQALGRILQRAGLSVTTLGAGEWCCGYPLYNAGMKDAMGEFVEHNLEAVRQLGATRLVTTCPSCYYTWKVLYPTFASLPPGLTVMHASQLLAELLKGQRIRPGLLSRVVTYHDPCDLGRKSGVLEEPREVLRSLPGVELREMANIRENGLCCGGGGDVKIFSHDTTMEVARRRTRQALAVEADIIVSACQQCKRALVGAVQALRQPLRVLDLTELVWETLLNKVDW